MSIVTKSGSCILKIAGALAANGILFLILPTIHSLMELFTTEEEQHLTKTRIVAEYVKPREKEKPRPKKQRMRKVTSAAGKGRQSGGMTFRFQPDLGVASGDGVAIQSEQEMEAMVFEEGEAEKDAIPTRRPPIPFPDRARELGIEGLVEVTFVVTIDGKVSVEEVQAPHPTFSSQVRRIMENQWKFKPAMNKGVPVPMRFRQVIEYKLD